jgi:hypothetical protein
MTEEKAWLVFGKYIKLRDTDSYGYGKCIATGNRIYHFKRNGKWHYNCNAGHYISRLVKSIMFDELNVHAQSSMSNFFGEGSDYRSRLVDKIGEYEVIRLEGANRDYGTGVELDNGEEYYSNLVSIYERKCAALLKTKMF